MKTVATIAFSLATSAQAFVPSGVMRTQSSVAMKAASTPGSSSEYIRSLPGVLAPVQFFDPLGLTNDKPIAELKRYREAEVTHGRVAMLAALGFLVGENFNPLFDGKITGPAINQFWDVPPPLWAILGIGIGICETYRAQIGWVEPQIGKSYDVLRENYSPGDIGWDPLGLRPEDPQELFDMQTKELQNGRLAMLAVAGFVAQEEVNGKQILETLTSF
jgi:hypothetical protein